MKRTQLVAALIAGIMAGQEALASTVPALKVTADPAKASVDSTLWSGVVEGTLTLMAQPMINPKPKETFTAQVKISAVHNDKWIAFRLRWQDKNLSEGGKIDQFSDGVAIQFAIKDNENLPPITMGSRENPVHLLHWKASDQQDRQRGERNIKNAYPNMNIDLYPFEFADHGTLGKFPDGYREAYSHGRAAGNPVAFPATGEVSELLAEGFGTTVSLPPGPARANGVWKDGEWSVVIARPLKMEAGSTLVPGKPASVALAVWQGGEKEVGSRKSLTITWAKLDWKPGEKKLP